MLAISSQTLPGRHFGEATIVKWHQADLLERIIEQVLAFLRLSLAPPA